METKVKVNIHNNIYNIQGNAPPEYIVHLAEYVSDKMKDVSKFFSSASLEKIAILAALNIADEYFQLREIKLGENETIEEKTLALISMLDEGLIGDAFARADKNSSI